MTNQEARKSLQDAMQDISSTRTSLADYRDRPGLPPTIHAAFENEIGKLGHALLGIAKVSDHLRETIG